MLKRKDAVGVAPGSPEGARSAAGGEPGAAAEVKRWSPGWKKEVVQWLLRGEPVDAISQERENDPVERELDAARRRIGELVMEVEILQKERRAKHLLVGRKSSR
jgi:transposase